MIISLDLFDAKWRTNRIFDEDIHSIVEHESISFKANIENKPLTIQNYGKITTGQLVIFPDESMLFHKNAVHDDKNGIGYIWFIEPYVFDKKNHFYLPGDEECEWLHENRDASFEINVHIKKQIYNKIYTSMVNGNKAKAMISNFGDNFVSNLDSNDNKIVDNSSRVLVKDISIIFNCGFQYEKNEK